MKSQKELKELLEKTIRENGGLREEFCICDEGIERFEGQANSHVKSYKYRTLFEIKGLTGDEYGLLSNMLSDWKLNLDEEKGTMEWIVKMLNGDNKEQEQGLAELRYSIGSLKCEVMEEELIKSGLEEEVAKFVVTKLVNEWIDSYWMTNNFSKENMNFLKNTNVYKYIMGKEVSLDRIYKRKEKIMKIYNKTKSHEQARKNIKALHEDTCKIYDALEMLEFDEDILKETKQLMNEIAHMFLEL